MLILSPHLVDLFFELFDLDFLRTDLLLEFFDLKIQDKLELLKFLNFLGVIFDPLVLVFERVLSVLDFYQIFLLIQVQLLLQSYELLELVVFLLQLSILDVAILLLFIQFLASFR